MKSLNDSFFLSDFSDHYDELPKDAPFCLAIFDVSEHVEQRILAGVSNVTNRDISEFKKAPNNLTYRIAISKT